MTQKITKKYLRKFGQSATNPSGFSESKKLGIALIEVLKWQRLNSRAFWFTLELSIDYTPRYFSYTPRISSVFFNFSSVLVNFISEFNACSIWLADLSRFNEIKRVLMSGLNRFLIIFFELANLHASEYRLSGTYAMSFQFYAPLRPTEFDPYLSSAFALP